MSQEQEILSKIQKDDGSGTVIRVYESEMFAIDVRIDKESYVIYLTLFSGHKHFAKINEILSRDCGGCFYTAHGIQFLFPGQGEVQWCEYVADGIMATYSATQSQQELEIANDVISVYYAVIGYKKTLDKINSTAIAK